jgi:hypothetical protein
MKADIKKLGSIAPQFLVKKVTNINLLYLLLTDGKYYLVNFRTVFGGTLRLQNCQLSETTTLVDTGSGAPSRGSAIPKGSS